MNAIADGRIAVSLARIDAVRTGIAAWLGHRRAADRLRQYATQLGTIEQVLLRSVDAVAAALPHGDEGGDDGLATVYERCRTADRRTVWIERVWRYFADRFAQRDAGGRRAECLLTADEMVWSCWRPCFAADATDARPALSGPVPLPFLDAVHAPEAFPATTVPTDLSAVYADAPFIREHLSSLPVPTVRVPVAAAAEPWQLGLLAHEVGHHLQAAAALTTPFREAVKAAVQVAGGTAEDAERWEGWSIEIFADLVSVGLLGPWALWPIAELELRLPATMTSSRGAYPPAAVRLHVLDAAVRAVGLDPDPAWPAGFGRPDREAHADLPDDRFVDGVVKAGLRIGPPGFALPEWVGLDPAEFAPGGECDQWQGWFDGGPQPPISGAHRAPRLVLAAAIAVTAQARRSAAGDRTALTDQVRERTFAQILAVRDPERRAADEEMVVPDDVGADLVAALVGGELPDAGDAAEDDA